MVKSQLKSPRRPRGVEGNRQTESKGLRRPFSSKQRPTTDSSHPNKSAKPNGLHGRNDGLRVKRENNDRKDIHKRSPSGSLLGGNRKYQNLPSLAPSTISLLEEIPEKKWYDLRAEAGLKATEFPSRAAALTSLKKEAEKLMLSVERHVSRFCSSLLSNAAKHGTAGDKIAGHVLLIQQCPVARTENLSALATQSKKSSRRHASLACEALKDLFLNDLLPSHRKLVFFSDNPYVVQALNENSSFNSKNGGDNVKVVYSEAQIILAWFEDFIKTLYANFILTLATSVGDELQFIKRNSIRYSYELLANCPEQEKAQLAILISKLSDRVAKDASSAQHFLTQLAKEHPPMLGVICHNLFDHITEKISLPATTAAALYRPILFLSEVYYKKNDKEFAKSMLSIWTRLFHSVILRLQSINGSKLKVNNRKKILRMKRSHGSSTGETAKKEVPPQVAGPVEWEAEIKLLRAVLDGISRVLPFTNVEDLSQLLEADIITLDEMTSRISNASAKISIVNAIGRLSSLTQRDLDPQRRSLFSTLSSFSTIQATNRCLLFNVLRSMRQADSKAAVSLALLRRLLQTSMNLSSTGSTNFLFKVLLELQEYLAANKIVAKDLLTHSDSYLVSQDAEEHFHDVPMSGDDASESSVNVSPLQQGVSHSVNNGYNPLSNNPSFARADSSHAWEIDLLSCAINPSLAQHAASLKNWNPQETSPMPDARMVISFEKSKSSGAQTPMDVTADLIILNLLAYNQGKAVENALGELNVNSSAFWDKKKRIYPFETFMADYFQDEFNRRREKTKIKKDLYADEEEEEDEAMDQFLDDAYAKILGEDSF